MEIDRAKEILMQINKHTANQRKLACDSIVKHLIKLEENVEVIKMQEELIKKYIMNREG